MEKNKLVKSFKLWLKQNKYLYKVLSKIYSFLYYKIKKWIEKISDYKAKYWAKQDLT